MEQMVAEGSILRDHIALHFTKVKWKYSQQKIGGGIGGNTAGGWDLSCNKSCA
jgi:type VI secretion system secreted protein Hcp